MLSLELLPYLFMLMFGLGLLNMLVFGFLWRGTGSEYYKMLFLAWTFGEILLLAHGLIKDAGALPHALVFAITFPYGWYLSKLLARLNDFDFKGRPFLFTLAVAVILSCLLSYFGAASEWVIFPITVSSAVLVLTVSGKAIYHHWRKMSAILKCFAVSLFLTGLHNLDYAFCYGNPDCLAIGFTFGIALCIGFTMFGLASVQERTIKEKAHLELELQYQARLGNTAKLSALGEMAGGVAHEINNPLQMILILSDMMRSSLKKEVIDTKYLQDKAEGLKANTLRIANIVSGLIKFSRDASQDPMQTSFVQNVVQSTLDLYGMKLREEGIDLRVDPIDPSLQIQCRPEEISQILLNLLNNAKDAVATVFEKWIEIKVERESDKIVISVADSGPGIPNELKDRIFRPFFTTKDVNRGTGLGLSVAKGIAESHGGALMLGDASRTEFTLVLPST